MLISFLIGGMSAVEEKFSIRRLTVALYYVTMVAFESVNVLLHKLSSICILYLKSDT